jgi:hypothetical protein
MSDLLRSIRVLEVSSRLQSAASSLAALAQGTGPDATGRDALKWTGDLLAQIDWPTKVPTKPGVGGGLAVHATAASPSFYASLIEAVPAFALVGITSQEDIFQFLGALYETLESGGTKTHKLAPKQLTLASELLESISESLVAQLSNNGLPKQPTRLPVGAIG